MILSHGTQHASCSAQRRNTTLTHGDLARTPHLDSPGAKGCGDQPNRRQHCAVSASSSKRLHKNERNHSSSESEVQVFFQLVLELQICVPYTVSRVLAACRAGAGAICALLLALAACRLHGGRLAGQADLAVQKKSYKTVVPDQKNSSLDSWPRCRGWRIEAGLPLRSWLLSSCFATCSKGKATTEHHGQTQL